jgi:hypothetical protein
MRLILLFMVSLSTFAQQNQYQDIIDKLEPMLEKREIILKPKTKLEFEQLIEELKDSDIEFDISGGGGGGPGLTNDSVFSLEDDEIN